MKTNRRILAAAILVACALWCGAAEIAPADQPPVRVLIVTGIDYPGHHWWETTPVLEKTLARNPRLKVEVFKDPYALGKKDLSAYDVLILHFMNWGKPDPDEAAREKLRGFVAEGGGLVSIHFACGAFSNWTEYASVIGRVWDKVNTHDPRGPFHVEVLTKDHPVTDGLGAGFDTDDELYTCLAGEKPVQVLASARSKVTGRDHPMALVHQYGKGRVFMTPLGHDAKALEQPGTAQMILQAVAWAARKRP